MIQPSPFTDQKSRLFQKKLTIWDEQSALLKDAVAEQDREKCEAIRLQSESLSQQLIALRSEESNLIKEEAKYATELILCRMRRVLNIFEGAPNIASGLVDECTQIDGAYDLDREFSAALTDVWTEGFLFVDKERTSAALKRFLDRFSGEETRLEMRERVA